MTPDEVFEKAWERMLHKPGGKFRTLNLAEQSNLKAMMRETFLAYMGMLQAVPGAAQSVPGDLKEFIASGFSQLREAVGKVGTGRSVALPEGVEVTPELVSELFNAAGIKTNIDEVAVKGGQVEGVSGSLDALKKLKET